MEYHISVSGNDCNEGTAEAPFKTISKAAALALPGDTITVHAGVYHEWVNPLNGGTKHQRIVYQAAEGETVTITGAEPVTDWTDAGGGVWKTVLTNAMFGEYNPYKEIIFGDWFFDMERVFHTGEVYLNGKSMYEAETMDGVITPVETPNSWDKPGSLYTWYCETDNEHTTIYANFRGADPRNENVEINVRPFVFWPAQPMRSYITVRGFTLKQAATQWAPPTALQTGLIGPHWSRGWIIENNIISDSKNSGISLGKDISTGHNEWTRLGFKGGTQREREVIFRAADADWQKECIGGHIVRDNIIRDCEQTGIVGHLGAVFSTIEHNHIHRIHVKRQFHGAEVGGIKFHAALDTVIARNFIHDCHRGLWLDWQAQGTHISRNVFYNNASEEFMCAVCHGLYTVDHNLFLSKWSYKDMSEGGAFIPNLVLGKFAARTDAFRYTPYHFPHRTGIFGVSNILGGDGRFYNNVFLRDPNDNDDPVESNFWDGAPVMDGMPSFVTFKQTPVGTAQYDDYPGPDDRPWWEFMLQRMRPGVKPPPPDPTTPPPAFAPAEPKLRVYCVNNVYMNNAKPCVKEKNPYVYPDAGLEAEIIDAESGIITVRVTKPYQLTDALAETVTTEMLGRSHHAEMYYEQPNGAPFCFGTDFFGGKRSEAVTPGPFEISGPVVFEITYEKI
jgi:hypothetical protein